MSAQTIDLECPNCKELLELDRGFAGGVCRCSNCGSLMKVPRDPSVDRAERVLRPAQPGDAGGQPRPRRPAASGASNRSGTRTGGQRSFGSGSDAGSRSVRRKRSSRRRRPEAPRHEAASTSHGSSPADSSTHISASDTASDREKIDMDETAAGGARGRDRRRQIPTARKRKMARTAIYTTFGLMVLAIVALCVFAVVFLT